MPRPTRVLPALVLALALAACQGDPTKPGGGKPTGPVATAAAPKPGSLAAARAGLVGLDGATLIGLDGSTLIGLDGSTLIGMDGSTLIGNDGSTLIGLDGSTLVGQDGASIAGSVRAPAGLVAAGGGNAISDMGGLYSLMQTGDKPLAGATVYLRTATGRFVFDPRTKKLLTANTDAQGRFTFPNLKALRGLTAYVPRARQNGELEGLACVRPADAPAGQALEVDLAATLQASWIYQRVLGAQAEKDRPASLDRLPTRLAAEARQALVQAQAAQPAVLGATGLATAALAQAADRLAVAVPAVGAKLEAIRTVMARIGGDSTQGGRGATETAFQQPQDIALGKDGSLYVLENFGGIVRRFAPDGTDTIVAGLGSPSEGAIGALVPTDMVVGPDGDIYVASQSARQIFRFSPDGQVWRPVVGGGTGDPVEGTRALDASVRSPGGLAFDPEGRLVFGEGDHVAGTYPGDARLFRIEQDGRLHVFPLPWAASAPLGEGLQREVMALAYGPDGALHVLEYRDTALWRLDAGATTWTMVATKLGANGRSDLLPLPGGDLLVSEGFRQEISPPRYGIARVGRDGKVTTFAGGPTIGSETGDVPLAQARFAAPAGLVLRPDGAVLVSDNDSGLVRAIAPDGIVRRVAGRPAGELDLARAAALSVPSGITLDPQGRVVVSEYGSHTVRRQEGDRLITIAGGLPGRGEDGRPADRLLRPVGIAYQGDDLLIADAGNHRLVRVRGGQSGGPGTLTVLAGGADKHPPEPADPSQPRDARSVRFEDVFGVTPGPDGMVYITDTNKIWRLDPAGQLHLIAGTAFIGSSEMAGPGADEREGKPALSVPTGRFGGIVVDKAGTLYATEFATCRVIKIDKAGIFSTHAGAGLGASIASVLGETAVREPAGPPRDAALLMPMGLAFDGQGRMYITEVGTRAAQAFSGQTPAALEAIPLLDGRIRMIDTDGQIKTVAGLGMPAGGATVRNPVGIVITPQGKALFVDNGTNQVKEF